MNVAAQVSGGFPVVGHLFEMRRDLVGFLVRVAREHGDVARSRQGLFDIFVVSGPDAAHEVFVEKSEAFVKSYALSVFARPILGDGLLTSEHDVHRAQRRRIAPAFAHKRVAAYADVMVARADAAAARMLERGRVDFVEEMMRMTLEIVGKALFDADVGKDADEIGEVLTLGMQHMIRSLLSFVPVPPQIPTPGNLRSRKLVARLDSIVYRIIEARRRTGEDRGDVLGLLLAPGDDGTRMTDRELRDHVTTLLLAGHETTANALAWTLGELARNPDVRERVHAEVDAFGGRAPSFDDLRRLPYCLATFKEAMRLHPPAYTVGRIAERSVTIAGHTIPKGRIVIVNLVGMHRRPDLWHLPDRFQPERFLPENEKSLPRGAYLPFGDGPRICIGNQFATMEGHLVLATLTRRALFELDGPFPAPEPLVTLRPQGGMPMRVRARP